MMGSSIEKITEEVKNLSSEEQNLLLVKLSSMIQEPVDENLKQKWLNVARGRLREIRDGDVETIPAEEVMDEAQSRLK